MYLLVKMLRKRLLLALLAFTSIASLAAVTIWWNAQLSGIIDTVSQGATISAIKIVFAVIIMAVMCAANSIQIYITGLACETLAHDLRMGYARHFSLMPLPLVERLNAGEELSKLQNEIADVSAYMSGNLSQLVSSGVNFITTLSWLLFINAKLTLTVNLPVLIIMLYVFYSSRVIGQATQLSQQAKGIMNKNADTLLALFPIIRLYDASAMLQDAYYKEVKEWEHQTVRAERTRARLMSLSGLLSNIPLMLLFIFGGGMVINGALSIGTLYIFLNLSGNVSGIMMNMPGFIAAFRQFSVNMTRISPKIVLSGEGGRL